MDLTTLLTHWGRGF